MKWTLHRTQKRIFISILVIFLSLTRGLVFPLKNTFANDSVRKICSKRYAQFFKTYQPKSPEEIKIKIGIEIEGSVPREVDLSGIARRINNWLKFKKKQVQTIHNPYINQYEISYISNSGQKKIFKLDRDPSVISRRASFEISSPILETPEDFHVFQEIVKQLKKIGGKNEANTGGIHIHIDFSDISFGETAGIAAVFSEIEEELMNRFSTSASRKVYTQPTSKELIDFLKKATIDEDLTVASTEIWKTISNNTRQHALNLQAYRIYNTVEFRFFNSTLDLEALELMHDFSSKLVQGIRTQNTSLVDYLVHHHGPIEVDHIAKILGMKLAKPEAQAILKRIMKEARNQSKLKDLGIVDFEMAILQTVALLTGAYVVTQEIEKIYEILGKGSSPVKQ